MEEITSLTKAKEELLKMHAYFQDLYNLSGEQYYLTACYRIKQLADKIRDVETEETHK